MIARFRAWRARRSWERLVAVIDAARADFDQPAGGAR